MPTSQEKLREQREYLKGMPLTKQERLDLLASRNEIIGMTGVGGMIGAFLGYLLSPQKNQFVNPSTTKRYTIACTCLFGVMGALLGTATSVQYNVDKLSKKGNGLGEELRKLSGMRNEFRKSGGRTTELTPEDAYERQLHDKVFNARTIKREKGRREE